MSNSKQIEKLSDIAKIIPGASNSNYKKEADGSDSEYFLLKGRNLDPDGGFDLNDIQKVSLKSIRNVDRYVLKQNDVVLMARGSAVRASFVTKEVADKKIIVSANFVIIRPDSAIVRGEVITAYLNSVVGHQRLKVLSKGAVILHLSLSDLRMFSLPVPSAEIQNEIAEIFYASRNAYQATVALAEQQRKTSNATVLEMMLSEA